MGYTKYNEETNYWASSQVQIDDTWLPIVKEDGVITSPQGLVDQIAKAEADKAKQEADTLKKEALDKLIVTNVSGIRFYADPESRTDLLSAVIEALENNLPDTYETEWKTPDGILMVSVKELKEAKTKALASKATVIGI